MATLIRNVEKAVRALVEVRKTTLGIEATVPVAYPGGELIDVVIETSDNAYAAHDSGMALMRVIRSGLPHSRSLVNRCKELAAKYDCDFTNARVTRSSNEEGLGVTIALVANAARAVADLALEPRRNSEYEFRREVVERVREFAGARVRENQELKGASGRMYRVPALVLDRGESRPQHFVAALAARNVVLDHVASFFDLHEAFSDVENEAIYDDTSDFRLEDRALIRRVAKPIPLANIKREFQGLFA